MQFGEKQRHSGLAPLYLIAPRVSILLSRPEFGNPENEGIRQANPVVLLINFKEKLFYLKETVC